LTPVSFVLTSLICGLALLAVIYASHETFFPFFAAPLLLIFIVVSIAATILNYSPLFHSLAPYFLCRIVLSILVALFLLNKKLISQANKKVSLLVILLTALFLSEVIGRYIFFLSFEKSGL
jgi:DMSO reductase anchor subunit